MINGENFCITDRKVYVKNKPIIKLSYVGIDDSSRVCPLPIFNYNGDLFYIETISKGGVEFYLPAEENLYTDIAIDIIGIYIILRNKYSGEIIRYWNYDTNGTICVSNRHPGGNVLIGDIKKNHTIACSSIINGGGATDRFPIHMHYL